MKKEKKRAHNEHAQFVKKIFQQKTRGQANGNAHALVRLSDATRKNASFPSSLQHHLAANPSASDSLDSRD